MNSLYTWEDKIHLAYTETINAWQFEIACHMPKLHFTCKHMSIISPSMVSFDKWELFDWQETERFDSFQKAQDRAEYLLTNNKLICEK